VTAGRRRKFFLLLKDECKTE
jgi:hypothetical protein